MAASPTEQTRWPNPVTAAVAHLFAYLLEKPVPTPDQNFAALGGDADSAGRLREAIARTFKVTLPRQSLDALDFTPAGVAAEIIASKAAAAQQSAPMVASIQDWLPALPSQAGLYSVDRVTRGEARPTVTGALIVEGSFDRARLEAAVQQAMMRHDGLRLRFETQNRQVMIRPERDASGIEDFSVSAASEADMIRAAASHAAETLDLDQGRGVRWLLCEQGRGQQALIIVAHHAVADAMSKSFLLREVGEAYAAGGSLNSMPLAPSFMAIAAERAAMLSGPKAEQDEAYWRQYLNPLPGDLAVPGIIEDGDGAEFERRVVAYDLDTIAVERLVADAAAQSATPFIAFACVMARCFAAERDGIVSVPISNRDQPGRQNAIGCLMQTVPLRLSGRDGAPYPRLREDVSQMLSHAALSVEELLTRGILTRKGLFEAPIGVQFQLRRAESEVIVDRADLRLRRVDLMLGINNLLPLSIDIKRGKTTTVFCDYDPGLVDPAGLDAMIEAVKAALPTS